MSKKLHETKMTFKVVYDDGRVEQITDIASLIKPRFYFYVRSVVDRHVDGLSEVFLLDCAFRPVRSYKQY